MGRGFSGRHRLAALVAALAVALALALGGGLLAGCVALSGSGSSLAGWVGAAVLALAQLILVAALLSLAVRLGADPGGPGLDDLPDGVLVLRAEDSGRLVYEAVNAAAEALLEVRAARLIGRAPEAVWPAEEARAIATALRRCAAGEPAACERVRTRGGQARVLACTFAPVRGADGRLLRVVETVRSAVEIARQAEALRHDERELAVARLAAGVAHGFNNLLQAQVCSLEMLLDQLRDHGAARRHAEAVLSMTQRGAQMIWGLLALARRQALRPRPVVLSELLARLGETLAPALGPGVELVCAAKDDSAALVDPVRVEEVLLALAGNARDAMPNGGRLRIEACDAERSGLLPPEGLAPGGYVVLVLADTGMGMSPEILARAGEPFFTTRGGQRAGLGLAAAVGFARQSGGELRLCSAAGKGTRAELWLPRAAAAGDAKEAARSAAARVLLVDDMQDTRVAAAAFLDGAGFEVVTRASAGAALAALEGRERPDVVVTDFGMPGTDGVELVRQARALRPDLPVLVTASTREAVAVRRALPDVPVLHKPFRCEELVGAVRALLRVRAEPPRHL